MQSGNSVYSEGANTALSLWKRSNHSSATTETPGDTRKGRGLERLSSHLYGVLSELVCYCYEETS